MENGATSAHSSATIENAAKTAGHSRTVKNTDSVWSAMFRDGKTDRYWDSSSTPDAVLHLEKAGTGLATLTQQNTYTGRTLVQQGNLQVGQGGSAGTKTAALLAGTTGTSGTTVTLHGTLSGTGVIRGGSGITHRIAGGKLVPGHQGGNGWGTLHVEGNLQVDAGGVLQFQIHQPHQYNSRMWSALLNPSDEAYQSTLLLLANQAVWNQAVASTQCDHLEIEGQLSLGTGSVVEITGLSSTIGSLQAGDVFNLIDWGTVGGSRDQAMLLPTLNAGLVWDQSLFNSHGLLLVTVVPEPRMTLLLLLGMAGCLGRRRR